MAVLRVSTLVPFISSVMAAAGELEQSTLTEKVPVRKRKSYSREEKLKIVRYYYASESNLYQTCKAFSLNSKTVKRWIDNEEKIEESKKGSKRVKFARSAQYPEMEERLHTEYKDLRKKGLKVGLLTT
jgi:transposase-like protein